jgi:Transcriptional Coactivator p15 (PC4)
MSDERVIFEFEKNAKERVRATLGEFKGREVASLRVWYDADENDAAGNPVYRPSKKGITLSRRKLPELLEAVQALIAEAS